VTGFYKYLRESLEQGYATRSSSYRKRLQEWRGQESVQRIERPTNLARARELGYRAKKEFIVVRVRMPRGKRRRDRPDLGRKPGKNRKFENPGKSWQWFAEQRALRKHKNLELVGSYWVGEDGERQYYEVILRNPHSSKPSLFALRKKREASTTTQAMQATRALQATQATPAIRAAAESGRKTA